ncbi:hypothetical protein [Candidatus Electronema sp. PJ]|uniref:hypothetical protein n=1 Tax=Candidatus Electronema sp. PJ TaxID=3401572 RepID=UPI003AA8D94E
MATVQWRPEVNALTNPLSYRPRFVPNETVGYTELIADICKDNPNYNEATVQSIVSSLMKKIEDRLVNGCRVNLENYFSVSLSFTARLNSPDDPLPPIDEILQVRISASQTLVNSVRQRIQIEKLPLAKKLPVIAIAEDTCLRLNDVVSTNGLLKITGTNLLFDQVQQNGECVLEGTRSGKITQTRFGLLSNTAILLAPNLPIQEDPWNNEYILSISTRYTENGTLRTGIYQRRLRSPLTLTGLGGGAILDFGILTGSATAPYVTVTGGTLTTNETVRIQAAINSHDGQLYLKLLDMSENGRAGSPMQVLANGPLTLTGFPESKLTSLKVTVNNYPDLLDLVKRFYTGRLVDVLVLQV